MHILNTTSAQCKRVIFLHVFTDMHTLIRIPTPPCQEIIGDHRSQINLGLLLNRCQNTLAFLVHLSSCCSSSGAQGGMGEFGGWKALRRFQFALATLWVVTERRGVLLSKPVCPCWCFTVPSLCCMQAGLCCSPSRGSPVGDARSIQGLQPEPHWCLQATADTWGVCGFGELSEWLSQIVGKREFYPGRNNSERYCKHIPYTFCLSSTL